ncbi:MAG: YggS family pyridoxal phosphate-dependent enzyme [bacterium]|mgnify:CR=1 FL=1|nr:YggS family pyridoxal phosphate-dependent enzyme [bacterium]
MAHLSGQADNHKTENHCIPSGQWGIDTEINRESVKKNFREISQNIAPCKPRIIGVTKYFGLKAILSGYEAGLRDFGESRVLDAIDKIERLPENIKNDSSFHFIGHLQSNKVSKAVKYFDYIQSVDSLKLAALISTCSKEYGKNTKILLQLNNAGEEQKFGYTKKQLEEDLSQIIKMENIELLGLMNIAPLGASEATLRALFRDVRNFRDELERKFKIKLPELSMGMSDDYIIAVSEGATMIRIGRKLFK